MKPALLLSVGLVAAVVVAGVIVIAGGGPDSGEPAASSPTTTAVAPPLAPAAATAAADLPAPAAVTSPSADAAFEAWAGPLRAAGLVVTAAGTVSNGTDIVAAGLVLEDTSAPPRWRWSINSATLTGAATAPTTLLAPGAQTLTVTDAAGTQRTLDVTADTLTLTLDRDASARMTSVVLEATGVAIVPEGATDGVRIGSLALRLAPPADAAARTPGSFRIENLVTASSTAPLGTEIELIAAGLDLDPSVTGFALGDIVTALQTPAGQRLANMELRWGVLAAAGSGTLGLDADFRPQGTFDLAVIDPLTVLDAFNAAGALDHAALPDVYAAILVEMGDRPDVPLEFRVDLTDGEIVLRGEGRRTGDLALGALRPLL